MCVFFVTVLALLGCARSAPTPSAVPSADPPETSTPVYPDCDDTGDTGDTAPPDSGVDTAGPSGPTVDSGALPDAGDPTAWAPAEDIVVYAVRHAEKDSEGSDPGLTEAGQARAEALAVLLADVPIDAIYATTLSRTQLTVTPTANDHGLPIITDVDAEDELGEHILCTHAGDTVLHAGHSYTLGDFFGDLGLEDPPSVSGYGQLWIVRIDADGAITVEETQYGE